MIVCGLNQLLLDIEVITRQVSSGSVHSHINNKRETISHKFALEESKIIERIGQSSR